MQTNNTGGAIPVAPGITVATVSNLVTVGIQAIARTASPDCVTVVNGQTTDSETMELVLISKIVSKLED